MEKKKVKRVRKETSFLPKDVKSSKLTVVGLLEAKDGLFYPVETEIDLKAFKKEEVALGKADLYQLGLDRCETALLGSKLRKA